MVGINFSHLYALVQLPIGFSVIAVRVCLSVFVKLITTILSALCDFG